MSLTWIRVLVAGPPPAGRPRIGIPSWLLTPGLAVLVGSLAVYLLEVRNHRAGLTGLDMGVYQGGTRAFLHGQDPYALLFTNGHLPYTYPPVSLPLLAPLAGLANMTAVHLMMVVTVVATVAAAWLMLRVLGYTSVAGTLGVAAAVTAVAIWCDPFQETFQLGQVNAVLMLLVVADAALPDGSRWKGLMTGVATAVKLTPAIFILYFLVTRRWRAAVTAAVSFVALTLVGWVTVPGGSNRYWLHALFLSSRRVGTIVGPQYLGNQSLHGAAVRLLGDNTVAALLWLGAALVVGVAGLVLAAGAYRRGRDGAGLLVAAVTGLLISPISWVHHWVWLAPLLLVLVDVAVRQPRGRQWLAALCALVVFVFWCWPIRAADGHTLFTQSLIWRAPSFLPGRHQHYHGLIQPVLGESYTLTGLALLVLAVWWLRTRNDHAAPAATEPAPAPVTDGLTV